MGAERLLFDWMQEHLSDAEFAEVFGMTRKDFYTQPSWKQDKLKRDKNLF